MNKKISFTIILIGYAFALLYFGLITSEEKNYNSYIFGSLTIFAQEGDESPIIKNSKIIEFNGTDYADVVNSRDIGLNSFTVSTWFNTNMNVTGRDIAFLINKGGIGTELSGHNLNYGLWLGNRERVNGGFETITGNDYYLNSQGSYSDGVWHNAILIFDNEQQLLKLFVDGLEIANNSTNIKITPDTSGK